MSKILRIKIVTPEKAVAEMDVVSITLPIQDGEVTLLPEHVPYIGALRAGEILVRREALAEPESLAVSGGFVEFNHDTLTILADRAERAEDIDIARAEEAKRRAEVLMKKAPDMSEEEYATVAAALEKELTRIKVARKHRSRVGIVIPSDQE